jgi:hypothetical protein
VLAYASDMTLLDSALIPHGRTVFEKSIMATSLVHALWFHRPLRADEWLLYAQTAPMLGAPAVLAAAPSLRAMAGSWPRSRKRASFANAMAEASQALIET